MGRNHPLLVGMIRLSSNWPPSLRRCSHHRLFYLRSRMRFSLSTNKWIMIALYCSRFSHRHTFETGLMTLVLSRVLFPLMIATADLKVQLIFTIKHLCSLPFSRDIIMMIYEGPDCLPIHPCRPRTVIKAFSARLRRASYGMAMRVDRWSLLRFLAYILVSLTNGFRRNRTLLQTSTQPAATREQWHGRGSRWCKPI
jgi:hypothetical protein